MDSLMFQGDVLLCELGFLDGISIEEKLLNIPGWWFQTFFIFHNIWDSPSH